jgi:hypothetical protein
MANKKVSAVNLLPEYLKTLKNTKFLSSTLDQLIQKPELESIDGYVGSQKTPTYKSSDVYISNGNPYQLDPALVFYDNLENIQGAQGYDDFINEIASKGGYTNNINRLLKSKFYSYNAHIDWDKLVNYQDYFWMPYGPETLEVPTSNLDIENAILGLPRADVEVLLPDGSTETVTLSNGMMLSFGGHEIDEYYHNREFYVEGVGTAIKLVLFDKLIISESFLSPYPDGFDSNEYDTLPYDNDRELPNLEPEYVTISRASSDLNPWSRYNRWVHKDVVRESAMLNGMSPNLAKNRAQRPIIEFKPDIKLYNYGSQGIVPVDLMDTHNADPFNTVEGATDPVYIDGVLVENGHRVIFNAATLEGIRGKVYEVVYIIQQGVPTLTLQPTYEPIEQDSITVLLGTVGNGTEWWYNGSTWVYAQQRETLNQAPLFDLFDQTGHSYGDKTHYLSDFTGNKIFSYSRGNGTVDPYLGYSIKYKTVDLIGSILFDNNLCSDSITVSELSKPTYTISANSAYIKIGNKYKNAWIQGADYDIPVLSSASTGILSYYEEPLGLTNNPLNGVSAQFTISELTDHVKSMIIRTPPIANYTPLRDRPEFTNLGTALISNDNPLPFAQVFLGKKEYDLISVFEKSAEQYGNFKLAFFNKLLSISDNVTPVDAVDQILTELNQDKVYENSYYLSDMAGYGVPEYVRSWTVTRLSQNNPSFPLTTDFDLTNLTNRAVYVYKNNVQLIHGLDYVFNTDTTTVDILTPIAVGDIISIKDYQDTTANYIPLTPSKLGLYPKFAPGVFVDNSYVDPHTVIQGHDGSITIAYGDYRDEIILELEKRIYNNIKAQYNTGLFDINSVLPGAFRTTDYSLEEVNNIIEGDFVRWTAKFGIDYVSNDTFDPTNSKTWNFYQTSISTLGINFSGSLRELLLYLYGTDKPHIAPWEMLGIYEKPDWWESTYGPAPYTNGNLILWKDIAEGKINNTVNPLYVRQGLLSIIPTDEDGNLIDPNTLVTNTTDANIRRNWTFGDVGPAELAWRRSSYYPFAVQRLLALTKPADYCAKLYDPSRMIKNLANQWTYGDTESFLSLSKLAIYGENNALTSGYSAFSSEVGQARDKNFISQLRQDLNYADYRLFCKLNGYADKDTLQIVIDAYEPTSTAPGSVLPTQNYKLWFNTSNPLQSLAISGVIVQKVEGGYSVRGYDKQDAYFPVFRPLRNIGTQSLTVGGISEKYVEWQPSGSAGGSGLSSADTTTASSAPTGNFYTKGQYVSYEGTFYRTVVAHRASATFQTDYFQRVVRLPTRGGATVQIPATFDQTVSLIPYGTFYSSIQEVYDLIVGYGRWLESQGFIFDEYNSDLSRTLDWTLTAEEFLFWTTQNWDNGSLITLSPFANSITCQTTNTIVDNLFDSFYEYSVLGANGQSYPKDDLNILRDSGICLIQTNPSTDGIYFARLNLVQKDHAIVFDNSTIFGDVIYNIETGNRQRRVKLVGFRTAGWDGGLTSPGFVYDKGIYSDWKSYTPYTIGDVVRFNQSYYSANQNVERSLTFDFTKWDALQSKPTPALLPNFDYKIGQFEDFYSLDIDNFDSAQQKLAQHLTGYTPRVYLNNIFPDPIAQYKFYQGFIREKGTKNSISKLAKVSQTTQQGDINYNEEWAFRVGHYGSYRTYQEIETPLIEGTFLENPQIINFVSEYPSASANDLIHYVTPGDLTISPDAFDPSSVFKTTTSTDSLLLQHSGYVRIGDVTATAYNENSLLDIANAGQLKDGDTVWLGFTSDGNWDIYRYTYIPAEVIGVFISSPLSSLTFTTKYPHSLEVGQIIGINQLNSQVDGIYKVTVIDNAHQFTVSSSLANITNAPLPTPGQLYAFKSVRVDNFDQLPDDTLLFEDKIGTKYWVDNDSTGWAVYEKVNNFTGTNYLDIVSGTEYGSSISKPKGSSVFAVGAPSNYNAVQYGRISLFEKRSDGSYQDIVRWRIGPGFNQTPTGFGSSIVYDSLPFTGSRYGLVFAGAPLVNTVKVSSINSRDLIEGTYQTITVNDNGFGSHLFVEQNNTTKLVLVGSSTSVHNFTVKDNAGTIVVTSGSVITSGTAVTGISGSDNARVIAIGLTSKVEVYNKSLALTQTIKVDNQSVRLSSDGSYMFVGNPTATNDNGSYGQVYVYKNINGQFVLEQTIYNPVAKAGMNFGMSLDITTDNASLVVTALGTNGTLSTTFDKGTMVLDSGITKIKGTELQTGSAYVYYRKDVRFVYTQELTDHYVTATPGTNYGKTVSIDDTEVVVGMPAISNQSVYSGFAIFSKVDKTVNSLKTITIQDTFVDPEPINRIALIDTKKDQIIEYLDIYDPIKGRIPGIAEQEISYKLMNDPAVYSIGLTGVNVDTNKNWLDEHVGELWWDLSTAKYQWYEQGDLEYRRNNWGKLFPGATIDVYEWVGTTLLPTEWLSKADTVAGLADSISGQPKYIDNSVISVKQVYDPITNSFTNVYYYWVKNKTVKPNDKNRRISAYDVASAIADPKAFGLKYASIINSDTIMLSNVGGIPVDNKISINIAQDFSTEFVQSPRHTQWYILEEGSSIKMPPEYLENKMIESLLGHDKLGNLVPDPTLSNRTKYGISVRPRQSMFDDRHSALRNIIEFANDVLLSVPITGYRSFVNLNAQEEIPDQYGNTYDHLVEDTVTLGSIDTTNYQRAILNCSINNNGAVDNITIAQPGYGYGTLNPVYNSTGTVVGYEGPTFTVDDALYATTFDNNHTTFDENRTKFVTKDEPNTFAEGLKITTMVNEHGSIVRATVVNAGKRFGANFRLISRPHTTIVQSDDTYNGKWTRFEWDYVFHSWNRAHTQSYNTTLYWNYVDYASSDYNKYQIYSAVVGNQYELPSLALAEGQYVKVNNGGDGNFVVLKQTAPGVYGSFGNGFDLVYKQNGTIQFNNDLWEVRDNPLNWDYINTYDQTLWDQTPDTELQYIFAAMKKDLFVYELKSNWNKLFFKAVRYALTEQKLLDWAFKTSFITLTHTIGELTQPPVYKMQDSSYYEDYVKEVKPYHTQIRQFVTKYTVTEIENTPSGLLNIANTDLTELDRTSTIELKFDRTSFDNTVGSFEVLDTFVADGISKSFEMSWVPAFDKVGITVKFNGIIALGSQWSVNYVEKPFNGFHKKFATLEVFGVEPLSNGTTITVSYKKNANQLNETERVLAYYTATYGVVGLDLTALVDGIGYPGLEVGGKYEGPGFTNQYGGVTPDSLITGGTWIDGVKNTALGINPEDITISGELGFINTFSGHAPSELLPGFTIDSLGVNVYTVGHALSPTISNASISVSSSTSVQSYLLPSLPASINSISVVLNNSILEYTTSTLMSGDTNFTIDWENSLLSIPPQTTAGLLHYSIIGVGGGTNDFGLIDHDVSVINGSSTGTINSSVLADAVQDVYVTVNGIPTSNIVFDNSLGVAGLAVVTVTEMDPNQTNVIQAWFFTESHNNFNQIVEQTSSTSTFTLNSTGTHVVELIHNSRVERLLSSQYTIVANLLTVNPGIVSTGDTVKVISFIDNTGSLGPTEEEFVGDSGRRFIMSTPVANDYYVWITLVAANGNTVSLVNGIDFVILDDNVTIQVSDSWNITGSDTVQVLSFKNPAYSGNVLGYRMFKDMLGGTTYTRYSLNNTTYLTQTLMPSDTEIHVNDASVLSSPIVEYNIPGVVLINSERIEFYQVDGNVLKQITRGTLGTGVNGTLSIGTQVFDQGTQQQFDTSEVIDVQYHYTSSVANHYVISKTDSSVVIPNTTETVASKGITLDPNFMFSDQVDVYLGGMLLSKDAVYKHDTSVQLDNIPLNSIVGTVNSVSDLGTITANGGDSYVDQTDGKVWTFTRTRTDNIQYPGWVFSGLTQEQPGYTITLNGMTQEIQLNNAVANGIELAIVKKHSESNDFNSAITTTTTQSLWNSTSSIAMFLKDSPTELPKSLFQSADNVLKDEQARPLTNENAEVLTGKS